jgi:D-alanyl-D-alanine carboxypeptidase
MRNIFLLYMPPGNTEAMVHYQDTIRKKVAFDRIAPHVTSGLARKTQSGPQPRCWQSRSSSFNNLEDKPYPPDLQAAAKAGTLKPDDCTGQNSSYASAAGGVISTGNDLATWIQALVGGKVFNADYQRRWFDSLQAEDPSKPKGQKYGYGIAQLSWGPNAIYFHGGETPGYNSKISYDPANDMTLIVWTNLTVSLDGQQTANTLWVKVLDQIYVVSPLRPGK